MLVHSSCVLNDIGMLFSYIRRNLEPNETHFWNARNVKNVIETQC